MTTLPPQPMCMPWGKELYATLRSGRPPASLRPMLPHRFIHHLPGRQLAIDAMSFIRPVNIGDVLCVYAEVEKAGRTSITILLEAWALRKRPGGARQGNVRPVHFRRYGR